MRVLHTAMLLLLAVPAWGASPATARAGWLEEFAAGKFAVVDLTHTMAVGMPSFSGQPNYLQELRAEYKRGFAMNSLLMLEHAGTHMDAPAHFAAGKATMEAVPAKDLVAPAVVIDFRTRSAGDPNATLGVEDLAAWERNLGRIPNGAVVILWTGWSDRWTTPDQYRNADSSGVLHFPGFSKAAADWLLKERKIAGVGTDTLSGDAGAATGPVVASTNTFVANSAEFPVHHLLNDRGKILLENLTGLENVPARDFWVVIGALTVGGGTGAPARILALVPKP